MTSSNETTGPSRFSFRAWHEGEMHYADSNLESFMCLHHDWPSGEGSIVMQSTGRESDKEIYECDIIEIEGCRAVVRWDDGASFYYFDPIDEENWIDDWNFADDATRGEVIGNIYENPSLLPT